MPTITIAFDRAAVISGVEKWTNYPVGSVYDTDDSLTPNMPYLVCGATMDLDSIKFKELTSAVLSIYIYKANGPGTGSFLYFLREPFVETDVTFASVDFTAPAYMRYLVANSWGSYSFQLSDAFDVNYALENGFLLEMDGSVATPKSTSKPYLELSYGGSDVGLNVRPGYPIGLATISKSIDTTFSWDTYPETRATLTPVVAQRAVLRWRYLGDSTYDEIICDRPTQCTIPANTFAEGTIQWQVAVTSNSGIITTSDWITTEVKEPASSSIALSPANTVIDGAAEQTFTWEHVIQNGTAQTAFDIQIGPDGVSWETIRHAETNQTSTTFAAGTLAAGDLWWRVRTYNLVGVAGAWSDPLHCIVIAAPKAPSITADNNSPQFALRWQQSGQQAYELMVDGSVIAKTFSSESAYRHNGYLEPGSHTVSVRIQNKYQMWSEWGTTTLQIENIEGAAIQLVAGGKNEISLSWRTDGQYSGYIVYRNGLQIAKTNEASYVDHFAIGETLYQVRGVYSESGNYTMSNIAAVTISPETLMIASVSSPMWIKLPLSASSLRSINSSGSKSVTYTHYIGNELPGVEIGEAVSKTYNLECAFLANDLDSICRFEALFGKMVCIKTPSQRRVVGVLSQMFATENRFYVTYRVPVTEVVWAEEMQK